MDWEQVVEMLQERLRLSENREKSLFEELQAYRELVNNVTHDNPITHSKYPGVAKLQQLYIKKGELQRYADQWKVDSSVTKVSEMEPS